MFSNEEIGRKLEGRGIMLHPAHCIACDTFSPVPQHHAVPASTDLEVHFSCPRLRGAHLREGATAATLQPEHELRAGSRADQWLRSRAGGRHCRCRILARVSFVSTASSLITRVVSELHL